MINILELPHVDARRQLSAGAPVFMFVNPVEYHGPHLSLHTDALISQGLARDLHARLAGAAGALPFLVSSDVELGVEPTPGRGTRHAHYTVLRDVVLEASRAVEELGARKVIFMTFHGSPLHNMAIFAGVRWLRNAGVQAVSPFNDLLQEMVHFAGPEPYAEAYAHIPEPERSAMMALMHLDFHAGFFETSLCMHYAPNSVSAVHKELPDAPVLQPYAPLRFLEQAARRMGRTHLAEELHFAALGLGWRQLQPFPGYTGAPRWATQEAGGFFARTLIRRYVNVVENVFAGRAAAPEPIMAWTEPLSLGGRVPSAPIPHVDQIFHLS